MPSCEESNLVARARGGCRIAFGTLASMHRRDLHAVALRKLGAAADAEDIVQEALLHAWKSIASFRGESSFRGWLRRIAINLIRMSRRGSERRNTDPLEEPDVVAQQGLSADEILERAQFVERFDAALHRLRDDQRAVFALRDLHGESTEFAARKLDISPANVRQRLHRARQRLRAELRRFERAA